MTSLVCWFFISRLGSVYQFSNQAIFNLTRDKLEINCKIMGIVYRVAASKVLKLAELLIETSLFATQPFTLPRTLK